MLFLDKTLPEEINNLNSDIPDTWVKLQDRLIYTGHESSPKWLFYYAKRIKPVLRLL